MNRDSYPMSRPPSLISSSSTSSSSLTSSISSLIPFPLSSPPQSPPLLLPPVSKLPPTKTSSPSPINPRHALMRSRRVSLPANLVQTNYHSLIPPSMSAIGGEKRMSVASVASVNSFDSVVEEPASVLVVPPPPTTSTPGRGGRAPPVHRHSLPPLSPNATTALGRATSPLGRSVASDQVKNSLAAAVVVEKTRSTKTKDERLAEKVKREERRWKIAVELRDTERSYLNVLKKIDEEYYQPLLKASTPSPLNPNQPLRRSLTSTSSISTSSSSSTPSPAPSPSLGVGLGLSFLPSFLLPSSQPPPTTQSHKHTRSGSLSIPLPTPSLPLQTIQEIFSNFSDVLRLSIVLLSVLESTVPDSPSPTLPIPTTTSSTSSPLSIPELSFSSSSSSSTSSIPPSSSVDLVTSFPPSLLRSATGGKKMKVKPEPAKPLNLGKALLPVLPFLKSYGIFVSGFSESLGRLGVVEMDESFKRWMDSKIGTSSSGGLGLGSMLLSIVQRVPRYRLVIGDLVRFTERDHPDRKSLKQCWTVVDSVANHLELRLSQHHSTLQLLSLQRRFTSLETPLISPGRTLIKLGPVRKLDRRGYEQERTLILFNDLLIVASEESTGGWRVNRRVGLEEVLVVDEEVGGGKWAVLGREKSFIVLSDSAHEKLDWMTLIRETKSLLLSDRRTLQLSPLPSPSVPSTSSPTFDFKPRDRRISLPTNTSSPTRLLKPLTLDQIPGTPSTEIEREDYFTSSPVETTGSRNGSGRRERSDENTSGSISIDSIHSVREEEEPEDGEGEEESPVVENYHAPVWVPDSKTIKCMKCGEAFGVWRRRHHCRLCGGVFCWNCSTKSFIIPSNEEGGEDKRARSCDTCFSNIFGSSLSLTTSTSSITDDQLSSTILEATSHLKDTFLEDLAEEEGTGGSVEENAKEKRITTPAAKKLELMLGR